MQDVAQRGHPRRWIILGLMVISLLVVALDNTVLNVAMKTIADPHAGLGASQSQLEWSINSYTLVFAGLLFTFGVLGDRWGRKGMLLVGLGLFGLASLASAYSQTANELIGARALMGIGGAAIMPATLSIISNVFSPRERARAIAIWSGSVGLAIAIGPIVGGFLLEHFWWGSVFLINVPIVIVGGLAIALLVPNSKDPKPGGVDVVGVLLSIAGLMTLVYGIVSASGEGGWGQPKVWAGVAGGAVLLTMFVLWELRSRHPSLDVRLFRNHKFTAAVGATGLMFFAALGTFFFSPFYLQNVRGYSPLGAGLLLVPFAAAQVIFAPRSTALVRRFGAKAVCAAGLLLAGIALAGFTQLERDTPIWYVMLLFFVQGTGMANVMAPATEATMSALPREKAGVGSAVLNTVRQVGGALGVAVLGSLLSSVYRTGMNPHVTALPAGLRHAATESITATDAVAAKLGGAGKALVEPANSAFIHAMHFTAAGSGIVALLGAILVIALLPGKNQPRHRRHGGAHEAGRNATARAEQTTEQVTVGAGAEPGTDIPGQRRETALADVPGVRSE